MSDVDHDFLNSLQEFCESVTQKLTAPSTAGPEAQLHGPLLDLLKSLGTTLTVQAESRAEGRIGIPDFAVLSDRLLIGYIETKAPGTGADATRFTKGHNARQWRRFRDLPNVLYTDGNEWALFQKGERAGQVVRLQGDVAKDGKNAAGAENGKALQKLLASFLSWEVIPPKSAKQLAELLAPICRMLRDEVADALKDPGSPLVRLADEWRENLFPDASDERFADAYAQTVIYALLLARAEGADALDLHKAAEALENHEHTMLSRALQVMTDSQAQQEIRPALRLVQRMVASVDPDTLAGDGKTDPWLYFYEDFLAAYDPQLRKDAGAYYTPVEVVRAQVRLVDRLLVDRLGMEMGFAEGGNVTTLDPAVGTGTYLLGVIEHAMARVAAEEGPGSIRARSSLLWQNIHGFEFMVSPYAVAELRLTQSLRKYGGAMPGGGPPVYLTNTLESPFTQPPAPPLFYEPIAQEHHRALRVKDRTPIRVCIGNPPYDRHEASTTENRARTGAWVRWGDDGDAANAPLNAYVEPVKKAGHGGHLKNLYNQYVYFWRWAFWKTFEHPLNMGAGIVTYISASSYSDGDAFVGMREHMRRIADEIWIIDLGGEGRGTRKSENVFAIQTPVAIGIAIRATRHTHKDIPAKVHYTCIEGTRDEKLAELDRITGFDDLTWEQCPDDWHAPFRPAGKGEFFNWPDLTDLMPWQVSGAQIKRAWPIAPDEQTLKYRWKALLTSDDRSKAFKETRDRKVGREYPSLFSSSGRLEPIIKLKAGAMPADIRRYAYRSFDRQYIIADNRVGDYMRPSLWQSHGEHQVYFTTLLNHPLGKGPALTVASDVPDLHHFRGSYGAKEVMPLFRDSAAQEPNTLPGLLSALTKYLGRKVSTEDYVAYLYGILAQPAYTKRFHDELGSREVHVPITKDAALFEQVAGIGRNLIWLHTYCERMAPEGKRHGQVPKGKARCTLAVPDLPEHYPESYDYDPDRRALFIGSGEFAPVSPEVWDFEVSGLKVVQSWLAYRMRSGAGRKSSPLDDIRPERWTAEFTTELLHLLWILEHTLANYPEQGKLLDRVLSGELIQASELPEVPEKTRKTPKYNRGPDLFE